MAKIREDNVKLLGSLSAKITIKNKPQPQIKLHQKLSSNPNPDSAALRQSLPTSTATNITIGPYLKAKPNPKFNPKFKLKHKYKYSDAYISIRP